MDLSTICVDKIVILHLNRAGESITSSGRRSCRLVAPAGCSKVAAVISSMMPDAFRTEVKIASPVRSAHFPTAGPK